MALVTLVRSLVFWLLIKAFISMAHIMRVNDMTSWNGDKTRPLRYDGVIWAEALPNQDPGSQVGQQPVIGGRK
jgi:hypothetical protein